MKMFLTAHREIVEAKQKGRGVEVPDFYFADFYYTI